MDDLTITIEYGCEYKFWQQAQAEVIQHFKMYESNFVGPHCKNGYETIPHNLYRQYFREELQVVFKDLFGCDVYVTANDFDEHIDIRFNTVEDKVWFLLKHS